MVLCATPVVSISSATDSPLLYRLIMLSFVSLLIRFIMYQPPFTRKIITQNADKNSRTQNPFRFAYGCNYINGFVPHKCKISKHLFVCAKSQSYGFTKCFHKNIFHIHQMIILSYHLKVKHILKIVKTFLANPICFIRSAVSLF